MNLRSLLAVAVLAPAVALAAPASGAKKSGAVAKPAAAPAESAGSGSPIQGLEVGGFIGYETDDISGLSLRVDGEVPFRELTQPGAPTPVRLSWVGSLGYSRLSWDAGFSTKLTFNVIKLIPAARFTIPLNPQFDVFGDAGLGLAYVRATIDFPAGTFPDQSDSSINLMMRLGAGVWYHVNPQLKLGAMLEFDPVFGDYGYSGNGVGGTQNTFLIQVGGMFKL